MPASLGVGFIGSGFNTRFHIQAWQGVRDADVLGVWSPNKTNAASAAKLARDTRAPVIPVGIWGTENVWPRNAKLPNVTNVTSPPLVTITVGAPVHLEFDDLDADTRRIMDAISALLPPEGREFREPTEDELRRTFPSNYKGDPTAEDDRRPGFDT